MLMTGSGPFDAERAFTRVSRSRRRAAVARWLRRGRAADGQLHVYDSRMLHGGQAARGVREIPREAIRGSLEPSRATLFDAASGPRVAPAAAGRVSGSPSTA